MDGIQEAGKFLWRFAFHTHGDTESAELEFGDLLVQHLPHEIGGVRAAQSPRAMFATSDVLEVC